MMRMNKLVVLIYLCFCAAVTTFAEAPELRYVMPNSWRKVTRLPLEEESRFLRENTVFLENIGKRISHDIFENAREPFRLRDCILTATRVYKEQRGEEAFYRLLTSGTKDPAYDPWDTSFLQSLVYKRGESLVLLAAGEYNTIHPMQYFDINKYVSIDIIWQGDRPKGILVSSVGTEINNDHKTFPVDLTAGLGYGTGYGIYFFMDDTVQITGVPELKYGSSTEGMYPENVPHIIIRSTGCLIDDSYPLRYSLQNAFDGDPATSYVENSRDDLMEIEFSGIYSVGYINRIALINGYAQSESLYKNNKG